MGHPALLPSVLTGTADALCCVRCCRQGKMVEYAAHFYSKLVSNSLTGLPLPPSKKLRIGLLGHSVGAGLATYVAQQAASQQQPYKSVMYMAPQTEVSGLGACQACSWL